MLLSKVVAGYIPSLVDYEGHSETERVLVSDEGLAILSLLKIQSDPGGNIRDSSGDEMNLHVPQDIESQIELKMLSSVGNNIISCQASKPNIRIVQDSLLGSYLMSLPDTPTITKSQFFDICMSLSDSSIIIKRANQIRRTLKQLRKPSNYFNGRGLISMTLPADFMYTKKNDANKDEPVVKIRDGVLYEGVIDKNIIGGSHNSIIQVLNKEYGYDITAKFIDEIQFITNNWLLITGFSVGLKDCIIPENDKEKIQEIGDSISKCLIEADVIKNTTTHIGVREVRVNTALGKAKDIGMRIAKDALAKDNNFLSTITSGSKGDFFNIAQITGLLGQQNISGERVAPVLNNGRRTLPHYPFECKSPQMEYESRGFIASSFIKGLNPREFYFHAMSGREGISDTAMGTATSGYMQRRMVKATEDVKVHYDSTVRDSSGNIYQFAYGSVGYDPTMTVKVGKSQEMCDITRLVQKLNKKHS